MCVVVCVCVFVLSISCMFDRVSNCLWCARSLFDYVCVWLVCFCRCVCLFVCFCVRVLCCVVLGVVRACCFCVLFVGVCCVCLCA